MRVESEALRRMLDDFFFVMAGISQAFLNVTSYLAWIPSCALES